jgi:hypothetical protein
MGSHTRRGQKSDRGSAKAMDQCQRERYHPGQEVGYARGADGGPIVMATHTDAGGGGGDVSPSSSSVSGCCPCLPGCTRSWRAAATGT